MRGYRLFNSEAKEAHPIIPNLGGVRKVILLARRLCFPSTVVNIFSG